jgi:hypothetical protein
MMHDVVGQGSVQDGRGVEFLPGNGSPNDSKDAGANDCADAQRCQRPWAEGLFQPMFRFLRVGDQLVNGLACEELVRQGNTPGNAGMDASGLNQKPESQGKFSWARCKVCFGAHSFRFPR